MIATVRLVNTSVTSHDNHLCVGMWWEHLRFTVMATFNYVIVLTVVTTLYIRSPDLIHLIIGDFYFLTSLFPFPQSKPLANAVLCFNEFALYIPYISDITEYMFFCNLFQLSSFIDVSQIAEFSSFLKNDWIIF